MRLNPEDALQRSCVEWFRWQYPKLKLIAIPNGGGRSRVQGAILKMTGVTAGVFDLFLIAPTEKYSGLWLEAKAIYAPDKNNHVRKNYMSAEQKEFKAYVEAQGYKACVFYTLEEFKKYVDDYIGGKDG